MEFLLQSGSEAVLAYAKENLYVIKTLKEFQYIDDEGRDQGLNVRQKSKEVTALLNDETRFKEARETRKNMRTRQGGQDRFEETFPIRSEDDDIRKAIEESKKTAKVEALKRKEQSQE